MKIRKSVKAILIFLLFILILNFPVTTRQGINYSVRTIKIPFYIKVIEFIDRDYQYKRLTRSIVKGCTDDYERVSRLFEWTCNNIRKDVPEGWPIVDDHIWYIIIRGYGADDQLADVFTTLCVYAGLDARMAYFQHSPGKGIVISAVRLDGSWAIFDPYYRVYFKTPSGKIATVKDLL